MKKKIGSSFVKTAVNWTKSYIIIVSSLFLIACDLNLGESSLKSRSPDEYQVLMTEDDNSIPAVLYTLPIPNHYGEN